MVRLTPEQLGETPPPVRTASVLQSALQLADAGWWVFPLRPGSKEPLFPRAHSKGDVEGRRCRGECGRDGHGAWDGTRDPERIRRWYTDHPTAGVAGAIPDEWFVVDLDFNHGAPEIHALPETRTHYSGRGNGNRHWVFDKTRSAAAQALKSGNGRLGPLRTDGIDIKVGRGSYIVLPPTRHEETGLPYTVGTENGGTPAPVTDEQIQALYDELGVAMSATARGASRGSDNRSASVPRARQGLSDLLAHPPTRGQGATNDWLTRVAGHYAKQYHDKRDLYETHVRQAACLVQGEEYPADEVEKTLESIWSTEQEKPPAVALDDAALIDLMAEAFRSHWRWSAGHGWLNYTGTVWEVRPEPVLKEELRRSLQDLYRAEAAVINDSKRAIALAVLLTGNKLNTVANLLKGALEVRGEAFDAQPDLLNVRNGVVHLPSGELWPHDATLLLTKITAVDYVPGARHPDWERTLTAVHESVRGWLQERIGQGLTGYRMTDELMPVFYGGGRNGKSTFMSSIRTAAGSHARTISDRVLTARDSDHPTELTDLFGLRLGFLEELPEAAPLNVKRLKDVVGQPEITARKISRDTFTWSTTHALFLATNHKPRVNETDHGTWRRLALVTFPYVFDGDDGVNHLPADPGLHDRMRRGDDGRLEAVLAWMIEGARRWYANGRVFDPLPKRVRRDTEEWRGESDVIVAYLTDRVRFDPLAAVGTTDLLADLNDWLAEHGKAAWGDQLFSERFGTHERVASKGVEKRNARPSAGVVVMGRDGSPLARQPERARLWFGVAFRARSEQTEIPW